MLGGVFFCFEGVEKVLYSLEVWKYKEDFEWWQQCFVVLVECDLLVFECDKVKGVICIDFILFVEIVVIIFGIVVEVLLFNQIFIFLGIVILVIIGVYGLVGVIVKLDDMGYWLVEKCSVLVQWLGKGFLVVVFCLMKVLFIVGMLVMFFVGGGIVVYGIVLLYYVIEYWSVGLGGVMVFMLLVVVNLVLGFIIGVVVLVGVKVVSSLCGVGKQYGEMQCNGVVCFILKMFWVLIEIGVLML